MSVQHTSILPKNFTNYLTNYLEKKEHEYQCKKKKEEEKLLRLNQERQHIRGLYEKLDNFIDENLNKERVYNNVERVEFCCFKPEIYKRNGEEFCVNCGKIKMILDIYEEDNSFSSEPLMRKYSQNTRIKGYSRVISRLHKWSSNYYDESELNKSFIYFDRVNKKLQDREIIERAKYLYKEIYIDKKITSRTLIRRGVYMYCICKAHIDLGKDIDFDRLIEITNDNTQLYDNKNHRMKTYTINNYNNAVKKFDFKLYYNKDIDRLYKRYKEDIKCKYVDILLEYNKWKKEKEDNKKDGKKEKTLNDTSIIKGIIYKKVKDKKNIKRYCREVKISILTLKKVLNKIL
jgi:hypothetical protein